MKHLRRLAFLPPVLLGAALLWWATANRPPPATVEVEERRVAAAYVVVAPRALVPEVSGFGEVAPARVWTAVAQVAGRVAYVHDELIRGGFVGAGETLIEIAKDDYELAVVRADADIRSAEARAEEVRLSKATTEASLAIEARALDLAERDLARVARLSESGTVSSSVVEASERDVLAQRLKVQNYENTLALLPAQLEAAEQSVAVARAAKASAELDLSRTVVTAPFDGRVSRVDAEISQFVGVGSAMASIDGAAAAEIDVQMSPRLMAAFARLALRGASPQALSETLSARATLGAEGAEAVWPAEVARISDTVDPETRSLGVIVRVDDPYAAAPGERPPLIKGMFVKVTLSAPLIENATLLPRRTIRDGRVMIAGADDRLAFASATPVFAMGDVAVLAPGGLPEGARVITSEPSPAIEGLLLAPVPDAETEARLDAAAAGGAE
ncbi:MAG: HlyD family efflux transporter periplasmic adaptor subunit [Pseudomonadota bacterium]